MLPGGVGHFLLGDGFAKHLGRNSEPVGHIGLHGEIHQPGLPSGSAFEAAAEGCRRRIAGAGHFGTGASASEPVWGVGHGQAGRIGKHPAGGGNANRSTANRLRHDGRERFTMKKLSNLCFAGALLLSHAMCAFVAANYVNITWEIRYEGYSGPASTACFLAIPYGIAIVACLALGFYFRRKNAKAPSGMAQEG